MEKILIIENCHLFRLQIKNALERNGFSNVIELSDADLASKTPQLYLKDVILIILEIELPGTTGIDFASRLKKEPAYCNIPVIFISESNDSKMVQSAIEAGGIDYIVKPFKFEMLIKRIEKVMNDFYGDVKGRTEDKQKKIMETITNEYERAERAGKSLSFLIYKVENDYLDNASSIIKQNIRKIDNVIIMNGRIFVILPLTREKNLNAVISKIQDKMQKNSIKVTLDKSVCFRPSTKKTLNDLKKELFGKK